MRKRITVMTTLSLLLGLLVYDLVIFCWLFKEVIEPSRRELFQLTELISSHLSKARDPLSFSKRIDDIDPSFLPTNTALLIMDDELFLQLVYPEEIDNLEHPSPLSWYNLRELITSLSGLTQDNFSELRPYTAYLGKVTPKFSNGILLLYSWDITLAIAPVISGNGELLGYVVMYRDTHSHGKLIRGMITVSLIMLVLLIPLSYLGSSLLVDSSLQPLYKLRDWALKAVTGNLNYDTLPRDVKDEDLAPIIQSITALTLTLFDYLEHIQLQRENLKRIISALPGWIVLVERKGKQVFGNIPPQILEHISSVSEREFARDNLKPHILELQGRHYELHPVIIEELVEEDVDSLRLAEQKLRHVKRQRLLWYIRDVTTERNLELIRQDMLASLSHELRTPLTAIKGFVLTVHDMLKLEGKLSPEIETALNYVDREIDRLVKMVEEMLLLARLKLKRVKLELEEVSAEELLKTLREVSQAIKVNRKDVDLNLSYNLRADVKLSVDLDRFKQVLINLLDNAFRHARTYVKVNAELEDRHLKISIVNDGEKLSDRDLLEIFERYTSKSGGTGIGLAISREIVQLHNGTLSAHNIDDGVSFIIKLPILK